MMLKGKSGPLLKQSRQALQELLAHTKRIIAQKPKDKGKLYALHAPEVECIAKGKARKPYEFGVKVSITTTHKFLKIDLFSADYVINSKAIANCT